MTIKPYDRTGSFGWSGMVTLQDVAHAAGVSIATASWAINDNKDVRIPEETKKRVGRIAKSGVTGGMPWRGAWHGAVRLDMVHQ